MRTWLAVLGVIAFVAVAGVGGYMIGQDASDKGSEGGNTGDAGGDSGQTPVFTDRDFRWNATVEEKLYEGDPGTWKTVHLVYYCPEGYSPGLMELVAGERSVKYDIRPSEGTVYLTIDAGGLPLNADDLVLLNSAKEHLARDPTMPTIAQ